MANHINKSRLCISFIILISLQTLHAQTYRPKKNYIGLHTGALSSSIKDELASPLTYKGSGAPIQLSYRFMGNRNRHSVYLSYSKLKLSPSAEPPYAGKGPVIPKITTLNRFVGSRIHWSWNTLSAVFSTSDSNISTFIINIRNPRDSGQEWTILSWK